MADAASPPPGLAEAARALGLHARCRGEEPVSPFKRCAVCVAHELTRDECFYASRCLLTVVPPGDARGMKPNTVGDTFLRQFGDPDTWNAIHNVGKRTSPKRPEDA